LFGYLTATKLGAQMGHPAPSGMRPPDRSKEGASQCDPGRSPDHTKTPACGSNGSAQGIDPECHSTGPW
jgi:hypothetical protein